MSDKKPKFLRMVTPIGEAKWAHVQKPKPAFIENGKPKGDPKYQIDVLFDKDDPEWKPWAAAIMKQIREMPQQHVTDKATGEKKPLEKQIPIKMDLDADDNPTGRFYATFPTSDKLKPGLFDKYNRPLPDGVSIGNGSKVRVNYSPNVFDAFGGGINFYLNAVQVLELVEYKAQTAESYGFTGEEPPPGGFETAGPTEGETAPPEDEDKIPF